MDLSPWLTLRQAADAVAAGRPDDAHRLLAPLIEAGHRKAWRAARDVAKGYCKRAGRAMDSDHTEAAWHDLLAAESLNTGEKCVIDLRQSLSRFGLVQARGALEAGDPERAAERAARLRERGVRNPDLPRVETAAAAWLAAAGKADRGDFLPAIDDLHRLRDQFPAPPAALDRFRDAVRARHERFLDAVGRAQEASVLRRWRDAVGAADEALAAAPAYHAARTMRDKAWQAAYPETGAHDPAAPDLAAVTLTHAGATPSDDRPNPAAVTTPARPGMSSSRLARLPDDPPPRSRGPSRLDPPPSDRGDFGSDRSNLPRRFLLWVDGVAGFLVCTGPRVTFGQAVLEGGPVDVPLFADVSRIHAELSRDGEGFLIEAGKAAATAGPRPLLVNGKDVSRSILNPGDRVTLGATCQFQFHRPVAVSATARLELTSGHRLVHAVEGVLLMANEVILGPADCSHVKVPGVTERVLLYRSKEGLGVRVPGGKVLVNDRPHAERAPLPLPATVEADGMTFAVEPVGPRV
ncbi:FHA domain-containing protein [bacterium]|nr:FHA domain-containing protein [bacterium]